jgi:hypothetical protein
MLARWEKEREHPEPPARSFRHLHGETLYRPGGRIERNGKAASHSGQRRRSAGHVNDERDEHETDEG